MKKETTWLYAPILHKPTGDGVLRGADGLPILTKTSKDAWAAVSCLLSNPEYSIRKGESLSVVQVRVEITEAEVQCG